MATFMYDPNRQAHALARRTAVASSGEGAGVGDVREGEIITRVPDSAYYGSGSGGGNYIVPPVYSFKPDSSWSTSAGFSSSGSDQGGGAMPANLFERGVHWYTHRLGLNFSLVLVVALIVQIGVAAFIGLNAVRTLPFFTTSTGDNGTTTAAGGNTATAVGTGVARVATAAASVDWWVNPVAVLSAIILQLLLISELAQVVWLRQPDRLKVRLMTSSGWWWVMLVALIATSLIDFLLLFLSVTGQNNVGAAWQEVVRNQRAGALYLFGMLGNLVSLLRCASVMRTSTSQEIRREVEERLEAIAEELLLDAGDSVRAKATEIWKKLAVNPRHMVPLFNAVFDSLNRMHPDLIPPRTELGPGSDTWAYDFTGNTFAALPPDVYQALLGNQKRAISQAQNQSQSRWKLSNEQLPWTLPPQELAQLIAAHLQANGQPRFVDATDPEQEPAYFTHDPALTPAPAPAQTQGQGQGRVGDSNKNSSSRHNRPVATSATPNPAYSSTTTAPTNEYEDEVWDEGNNNNPTSGGNVNQFEGGRGQSQHRQPHHSQQPMTHSTALPQETVSMATGTGFSPDAAFLAELSPLEQALFGTYLAATIFPSLYGRIFPTQGLPNNLTIFSVFEPEQLRYYLYTWKKEREQGPGPGQKQARTGTGTGTSATVTSTGNNNQNQNHFLQTQTAVPTQPSANNAYYYYPAQTPTPTQQPHQQTQPYMMGQPMPNGVQGVSNPVGWPQPQPQPSSQPQPYSPYFAPDYYHYYASGNVSGNGVEADPGLENGQGNPLYPM